MSTQKKHKNSGVSQRPRSGKPVQKQPAANARPGGGAKREDNKEVVLKGRSSKRKAFFERHTGLSAQLFAGVVVLVALVMLLVNYFDKKADEKKKDISIPAVQISGPEFTPPSVSSEVVQSVQPQNEEPQPLAFSEEQVAAMDTFLAAWAEVPTMVDVRKKDDDGNLIGKEPQMEERGGHDVGVWFYDVQTGVEYSYNIDHQFIYASLMKAPYATYLYQLADAGECDLAEVFVITGELLEGYEENSGVLKDMRLPQNVPCETLIGYALEYSDTVALRALTQKYPAAAFKEWAAERGVENTADLSTILSGKITLKEYTLLFKEVYAYMENGPSGALLKNHMMNTKHSVITSQYPVAHKYGWDKYAYHDAAAVFAPEPYLLVVMTDKWAGSRDERKVFGEIAAMFEQNMSEIRHL